MTTKPPSPAQEALATLLVLAAEKYPTQEQKDEMRGHATTLAVYGLIALEQFFDDVHALRITQEEQLRLVQSRA